MGPRISNGSVAADRSSLDPEIAYRRVAETIWFRLKSAAVQFEGESSLIRAERIALHVRKIVEAVAYAALSGVEVRNRHTLAEFRTMDADKLLQKLFRKGLLRLPTAQRLGPPQDGFAMILEGGAGAAKGLDLDKDALLGIFSRASALVHERHPERLSGEKVTAELAAVELDYQRLRDWLWLHTMYLTDAAFLIQMGQYGTSSFMVNLVRERGDTQPST